MPSFCSCFSLLQHYSIILFPALPRRGFFQFPQSLQLFTAKYLLHMPTQEELRNEIEAQKAIYYSEHPEELKR